MSQARATSFGTEAANYESARPDYPFDAVAWMLEPLPTYARRVADVGAGTGKLTRVLTEAPDADVVAVDPDPEMLATLRQNVPGVPTFVGTAESLPLPGASVDAVVLGQAWHWVDPVAGSAEIGRVLRPGGVLGLIWNLRDDREPWVQRLTEAMHTSPASGMFEGDGPRVAAPFSVLQEQQREWTRPMSRAQLHRMADSRSYLITASEQERARIHGAMDELFDDLGLDDAASIDLPYVTRAFRAVRDD